jgi:hypothetical protein
VDPVKVDLWIVAALVVLINLPFGYWRAGLRKLSVRWFVAVHAAVPLVIGLRVASGLGFHLSTVPVMVGAYFTGQILGGRARAWWTEHSSRTPGTG